MMGEKVESTICIMVDLEHIEDAKIEVKTEAIDPLHVDTEENIESKAEIAKFGRESSDIQGKPYNTCIIFFFLNNVPRLNIKIRSHNFQIQSMLMVNANDY